MARQAPNSIYDCSTKELGFPGRLEHMPKRIIDPVAAEAELLKGKRVLRAEKKKAKKLKGDKRERANMERSIETVAAGVKAVEKLRDAGEELVAKAKFSAK